MACAIYLGSTRYTAAPVEVSWLLITSTSSTSISMPPCQFAFFAMAAASASAEPSLLTRPNVMCGVILTIFPAVAAQFLQRRLQRIVQRDQLRPAHADAGPDDCAADAGSGSSRPYRR